MKFLGIYTEPDEYVISIFIEADCFMEANSKFITYLFNLECEDENGELNDSLRVRPFDKITTID